MNIMEALTGTTATLSERIYAAMYVSVVGVAVVFVVLVVLVVMVSILKRVDAKFTKKDNTDVSGGQSCSTAVSSPSTSSGIDPKIIAVISAAVAATISSQGSGEMVMPGMVDCDSTWKLESRTINHNNHMPKKA